MVYRRAAVGILVVGSLSSGCSLLNRTVAVPPNRCGLYGVALVTDLLAMTATAIAVGTSDPADKKQLRWLIPGVFGASGVGGIVGAIMCKREATAYARTPHEVTLPIESPPLKPAPPVDNLPVQPLRMR